MRRTNEQGLGEVLREFFENNIEIHEKIMAVRIERAWKKVLVTMAERYTTNIYVKDRVLHVQISSSVLRNELLLQKELLIKNLNNEVEEPFLSDIVIR